MFTHLRRSGKNIFVKLILILLVAMFALWGIGDVFRSAGAGPANVATVGKTPISVEEFHSAVGRSHGQPVQVLSGLINDALIEQEEAALGIAVSDDAVVNFIRTLPEFKGKDGQFDAALYKQMLHLGGTTEGRFVEDIRHEIGAKLLIGALTGGVQVPEEAVRTLYAIDHEQRSAGLIFLSAGTIAPLVPALTDNDIRAYYDAHPKEFTAPEVRTLSYITLPLADVQSGIKVSEEDIKRTFAENKENFIRPEQKYLEDLQFDSEQDAKATADKLAHGMPFAQALAAAAVTNKGRTSMGNVTALGDKAEAPPEALALRANASTPPMFANVRWHIYYVSKVEPERPLTFAEAHDAIARDIAAREAQDTIVRMMTGFEDMLAGGAALDKAAATLGQKVRTAGPVTHEGNTADGQKADLPPYDNFLNVAFATAEKDHSQAVQAKDGSYFLIRVDSVSPEHVRPPAEVKDQAAKAALAEKVSAKLEKVAEGVSEQLRAGKPAASVLAGFGLKELPAASGNLLRTSLSAREGAFKDKPLPPGLAGELFRIKPGESTHAYPLTEGGYMIATLATITPAPAKPDPAVITKIRADLLQTYQDDILHQYLGYLRNKYPISLNAAALQTKDGTPVSNHPEPTPSLAGFSEIFASGEPHIVSATLIADLETPVSAMLKLLENGEPSFLLESVQGGEARGRYSIIGIRPDLIWKCKGSAAWINRKGTTRDADFERTPEPGLASLKRLVRECRIAMPEGLPPMAAGLIGYMGYDMVRLMEQLPDANPDAIGYPTPASCARA